MQANATSHELYIALRRCSSHYSVESSKRGVDMWDAGAVLPPPTEVVQFNDCIRHLVFDILGGVNEGRGNCTKFSVVTRTDRLVCCTLR